jgi:predicted membrane protein
MTYFEKNLFTSIYNILIQSILLIFILSLLFTSIYLFTYMLYLLRKYNREIKKEKLE